MSSVYRAYDPVLDRTVAVKILLAELAGEEEYQRRFLEEARALGQVKHPNLVRIDRVCREQGTSFYVMELIDGPTLREVLGARGRCSIEEALAIFGQFLRGLEAVHRAGIIHRDIKPGNLMLDGSGRVRLMDFGLARRVDRRRFTLAGSVLGTPEYMSPEQAQGKTADERSDLYSGGVILYEMLCSRPPFEGKDTISILRKHVESEPPPLAELAPGTPPELVSVVERLLAKKPGARYPHARDLSAALAPMSAAGRKPEEIVRELVSAVREVVSKQTRATATPPSWDVPTAARPLSPTPAEPSAPRRQALSTTIAVSAAVIAVAALLLAILAVAHGPTRPPGPPDEPPVAPQAAVGNWWRVSLRQGKPFAGRLVDIRRGPNGRTIMIFEDQRKQLVEIPASNMRTWRKEVRKDD